MDSLTYLSELAKSLERLGTLIVKVIDSDEEMNPYAKEYQDKKLLKLAVLIDRIAPMSIPFPDAMRRYPENPTAGQWYKTVQLLNRITTVILKLCDEIDLVKTTLFWDYRDDINDIQFKLESRREFFEHLIELGFPREAVYASRVYIQAMKWSLHWSQLRLDKARNQSDPEEFPAREEEIQRAIQREGIEELINIGSKEFPRPTDEEDLTMIGKIGQAYEEVKASSAKAMDILTEKLDFGDMTDLSSEMDDYE